jgi:two-component system sensor histidine kinase BarA
MNVIRSAWRKLPIGSKLTLITSTLIVLVVVLLTLLTINREQQTFRTELEAQTELLLDSIPLTMRDELYLFEVDEIADVASAVAENENVTTFVVFDASGRILVDTSREGLAFTRDVDPLGEVLVALPDGESWAEWQPEQLVAGRPVRLGNQVIGAVLIGLSNAPLQAKIMSLQVQSLLISLGTIAMAALVAFLFSREITASIRLMAQSAEQMAAGDLETRVALNREDELGRLAATFNQMAIAIGERESELRDLNLSLEEKVRGRTAELSAANQDLVTARNEALEASHFKTQLLANVSHDLRTPLNVILGYGEMIKSGEFGDLSDRGGKMVREIIKSAGHLLQFVNNLIDQAQIDSGKVRINNMPFEPQSLLDNAFSVTRSLAEAKGLELRVSVEEDVPPWIIGDLNWLYQILYNLISNAVKFTDEGEVTVRIFLPDAGHWAMAVQDTGIGIPPEEQSSVFEAFYQVDGSTTRRRTGSGLGLSIIEQLTTLMNGRVDVQSTPGTGSTFTVTLPLEQVEMPHG